MCLTGGELGELYLTSAISESSLAVSHFLSVSSSLVYQRHRTRPPHSYGREIAPRRIFVFIGIACTTRTCSCFRWWEYECEQDDWDDNAWDGFEL